jgi:hypothetical protein
LRFGQIVKKKKKNHHKKRAGGVAPSVGPEFKPQYQKKTKTKNNLSIKMRMNL